MFEKSKVLEQVGAEEWSVAHDDVLICPHGYRVEDDGGCSEGCTSPLREAGLI